MDIATIIGLVGGSALVLSAVIIGGSALIFINIPGVLIVVGGTLATCFIKFSMGDVINTIKVAMKAFLVKMEPPDETVTRLVALAKIAKKEGLIALENEKTEDGFTAKAVQYLSDGIDEGLIEDMLNKNIRLTVQRHSVGQSVFKGRIGTGLWNDRNVTRPCADACLHGRSQQDRAIHGCCTVDHTLWRSYSQPCLPPHCRKTRL